MNNGIFGTKMLNKLITNILTEENLIPNKKYYHGMPIIITENNYFLELYNGDIGIIIEIEPDNFQACFKIKGEIKSFDLNLIYNFAPNYAITIHKSQGSEFKGVFLIIPPEKNFLLSKKLFYTAITRAKEKLIIWLNNDILTYVSGLS